MQTTIRQRFSIIFVLLILLPALALGFATLRLVRESLAGELEKEQLLLLQSIKTHVVDRHVEDMENALRTLAREPQLPRIFERSAARRTILRDWELTRALFPERSWIYFGTPDNQLLVSPKWKPPPGYDLRLRPWYMKARFADDIVWVDPYVEFVTHDLVMSAAVAIRDEAGAFQGVLSMDTHMNSFFRLFKQDAGNRTSQIAAVSERGETLMLNEKETTLFDMASLPQWNRLSKLNNQGSYFTYQGSGYYATFVNAPRLRMKLVSIIPATQLYREIQPILWTIVGITAAFVLVALAAGFYFSRHFITNIERLNQYMSAVEAGDYRIQYCVSSKDEFYQLNSRLNTMVHHLAENIRSLKIESNTDALCQVKNRRALLDTLQDYVRHCATHPEKLCIAMLDVDHFKETNDTFGHTTGDEVLRRVAGIMRSTFPENAIVGRYGGEEFLVILPGLSRADAVRHAEHFRTSVEQQTWRERELVVTLSGGVAALVPGETPEELIRRADRSLYQAKKAGRNRVL